MNIFCLIFVQHHAIFDLCISSSEALENDPPYLKPKKMNQAHENNSSTLQNATKMIDAILPWLSIIAGIAAGIDHKWQNDGMHLIIFGLNFNYINYSMLLATFIFLFKTLHIGLNVLLGSDPSTAKTDSVDRENNLINPLLVAYNILARIAIFLMISTLVFIFLSLVSGKLFSPIKLRA